MRGSRPESEAEARYRRLVEHLPAIVYTESVEDGETKIVYVSPQIRGILGIAPEDWIGSTEAWLRQIHPEDRDRVLTESRIHDDSGEPYKTEYRLIARDGHVVLVHDQSVLVRDEAGNPRFWHGVLVDITERKRAEELERALEAEREPKKQPRVPVVP